MESFKKYVEGLKKEKEERQKERQEEDIIDEIADRVAKKIWEELRLLRPVIPYCPFDCPHYFIYPYCPSCAYHPYTVWTYPPTYSRIPQTYSVDPTDATHTYNSWGYEGGEKDE